jgi:DNA-directed RNA polymerase subunit RPC12/RpoP
MSKIYSETECKQYQLDIQHPFHDTEETFEVYECPDCKAHFMVESEALETLQEMSCPYCNYVFRD